MASRPAPAAVRQSKPAAPAPKAKAVAAPVVTLKAIFEQLGETQALPKWQALDLLADFVATMTTHLKRVIGSA